MALTDAFVKNVKAGELATGQKHTDGQGLFLHVKPAGKYWRMSYRFAGKQKTLALGVYPAVSLAKARQKRDQARTLGIMFKTLPQPARLGYVNCNH